MLGTSMAATGGRKQAAVGLLTIPSKGEKNPMSPSTQNAQRLAGRVAIVTGGGRGIGREVASAFARHGAGVMIADLGVSLDGTEPDSTIADAAAAEIRDEGGKCVGTVADVGDFSDAQRMVAETVSEFGGFDILVNAAGIIRRGSILELTPEDWEATIQVHVTGTLHTSRAAIEYWNSSPGSERRLINFASDAGLYGESDYLAYGVAKAGVVALTLGCVELLDEVGGTANIFIPQAATRMTASIPIDQLPDSDRWQTGEFHPANVPPALVYLASEKSDWLSGEIIGGWGHEVHLYAKPRRHRSLFSPGPWEIEDLFRRIRVALEKPCAP